MRGVLLGALILGGLVIAACGGGGAGTPAIGNLRYQTNWRGASQSQRVTLFSEQGTPVKTLILNRAGTANGELSFDSLPQGSYRLVAELFSQTDLVGVQTGELSTWLSVSGSTVYRAAADAALASLKVTPESKTVQAPGTFPFGKAGVASDGTATFVAPGSVTWQAFGGVGAISASGNFQAQTAGTGSVRATHGASGQVSAASVTVDKPAPRRTKWTILVYINAANDLYSYSDLNMNQLERVAGNDQVRYIVQWKQSQSKFRASSFDGTRRYEVRPDNSGNIASRVIEDLGTGVDMGRPESLRDFLTWGTENFPADRTGVIVWNHGNGWRRKPGSPTPRAVSYDDETGNAIQTWELGTAFGDRKFEFIAWDASLMQMMEVAYEVRNNATFVIGSQESPPPAGYPYDSIFAKFRDTPDDTTRNLSKAFVDGMLGAPGYANEKITQSVLETSKLGALAVALDGLAGELLTHNGALATLVPTIRNNAQRYSWSPSPPRYFYDMSDVVTRLKAGSNVASIDAACDQVLAARTAALVWEGHNANSAGSRGIAIDFTPGNVFLSSSTDYSRMAFGQATKWDDWLALAP